MSIYRQRFRTREQSLSELIQLTAGTFARETERREDLETYGFIADPVESEVLAAVLSDLREYLEPLLMRQDRMTMAASVECRLPFLDYSVAERLTRTAAQDARDHEQMDCQGGC